MIELKILDPRAIAPEYGTECSAGVDLVAILDQPIDISPLQTRMFHTGIALNMMEMPEDMMACIYPRSGKGAKEGKVLGNLTGIIDQDYHGEIMVSIWNRNPDTYITISPGEKIAQLVFVPIIKEHFKLVKEFSSETERGAGGFGSTGS